MSELKVVDSKFILNQIIEKFPKIRARLTISEKELSLILGNGFSVSTLEKMRRNGMAIIPFIQPYNGGKVLYPLVFLIELLGEKNQEDRVQFCLNQLNKVNKGAFICESKIATLFGISPSTLSNYYKKNLFIRKINNRYYLKNKIPVWILESAIQVK